MKLVLVLFADWELNSDLISGLSFRSEFWQGLVPGALEGQVTPLRASLSLGLPFFLTPCSRPWFTIFSGKVQTAPGPDSLAPAPIQPIPPLNLKMNYVQTSENMGRAQPHKTITIQHTYVDPLGQYPWYMKQVKRDSRQNRQSCSKMFSFSHWH